MIKETNDSSNQYNLSFSIQIVSSLDKGMNFELRFENSNGVNYVLYPSPDKLFTDLSICLWMKTSESATLVSYSIDGHDSPLLSFGIDSTPDLFLNIGGSTHTRYLLYCYCVKGQYGNIYFWNIDKNL